MADVPADSVDNTYNDTVDTVRASLIWAPKPWYNLFLSGASIMETRDELAAPLAGTRETERTDVVAGATGAEEAARSLEQREEAERLERALAQLPAKQRLAVALRVQQGLSYREISEIAGGSEGAARVNYHLGIKRLRELLQ